ncbi:MAG: hypothetical protein OHK0036_20350 [Bacteroidia bacterium]
MRKNILALTYWDFDDALVQTYTLPYLNMMCEHLSDNECIYLLCLNKKNKASISFQHPKIKLIAFSYYPFGAIAVLYYSWMLVYLLFFIYRKNISFIHAWCTPAGAFAYMLSKLTHKPLIIDSYEPHAEAMVEVGEWKKNSLASRLLFYFEKQMTHHAKFLIATTEKMITEYATSRYNYNPQKNNWFTKPACVDLNWFQPNKEKREIIRKELGIQNKVVGIYAGKFGGIYLEDEFFLWLRTAYDYLKEQFSFILLSSHSKEYIYQKCQKYNINHKIIIHRFVPHKDVVNYLNAADFGITPVKPVFTKQFCSPIKNGEYWAMGLSVIITKNISDDSDIIEKNNIGYVLKNLSQEEYSNSIKQIENIIHQNISDKIISIAHHYRNFNTAKIIYQKIYS